MKTNIRWLGRVDRPFPLVSKALIEDAHEILHSATSSAEKRVGDKVVAELHTTIAGMEFQREVLIEIKNTSETKNGASNPVIIELEWKSTESAYLFPTMRAKLAVRALGNNTQLDFRGEYDPPFGFLGHTIDTMLGARIAESCVEHFVSEIADQLQAMIPQVVDADVGKP